jgi:hydroxymethylpyrimidine pyrophosphatase-like HAD family hydrolase
MKKNLEIFFPEIGVIRTSSPLGTPFIWMELFDKTISKGNAISIICNQLGIERHETAGIGNDYNDLDLLRFTKYSALVENSPSELKTGFSTVPSNENDGFAFFTAQYLSY